MKTIYAIAYTALWVLAIAGSTVAAVLVYLMVAA